MKKVFLTPSNSCRKNAFTLAEFFLTPFNSCHKNAFTLAEVLITLGIIGVVATLAIPNMIGKYQKKVYVTGLHKVYNELSQAVEQVMTDNNAETLTEAGITSQTALENWVEKYFKISRNCGTSSSKCLAPKSEYKKLKKASSSSFIYDNVTYYALASGAVVAFEYTSQESYEQGGNYTRFQMLVDINGKKKPNTLGRDVFIISGYNDGAIDDCYPGYYAPLPNSTRESVFEWMCNKNDDTPWGCFGKILADGWQMNY